MDLVNKFYSSVSQLSSSVQNVTNLLPGNPVNREFDQHELICTAGIGLLWKVYKGYKKSTKQLCAIFAFDKKQLEKFSKDDRDQILEILRKGILQLTKIRHPQVLHVEHPLEESTSSLMFVTEPVFASLANILGNSFNLGHPIKYKLHDIEIKYGLMQLCEGLGFLHNECKLLHRNICPESVIINQQGAWKIFGFDYCVLAQVQQDSQLYWPFIEYNQSWHALSQPSLEFMAPEHVLISKNFPASDIYSLGILIYSVFYSGKPAKMFGKDFGAFKRYSGDLKKGTYPNLLEIPEGLVDQVRLMLNATPEIRPNIYEFPKIKYFDDVGVKTLSYLDSLFQWDNLQKSKFFKGLPQIISKLPHRINLYRVLPCLVKEFVNPSMIPFVLPNVLLIAEGCKNEEFEKHILVHLKPIMKIQEPVQILLIFMQKMDLLLKVTPHQDIKTDVLPMLYRALESDSQQIQEMCLSILPTFSSLIDYNSIKNAVLPRIKKLCLTTGLISVRVNCLLCISKLLDFLDKWLVMDEIIPFLAQIQSREPAVLMGITGIVKLCMENKKLEMSKETLANKVIPFLVPLCIESGLSISQFSAMMTLVKTIIEKIDNEHRTKLEQLQTVQKEAKYLQTQHNPVTNPTTQSNDSFTDFGLEKFLNDLEDESSKTSNFQTSISSGALNLQDKQRLAQQQQQKQSQLQPTLAKPAPPKTRDLTSSLLESNLSQLKFTNNDAKKPLTTSYNNPNPTSNWDNTQWSFDDLSQNTRQQQPKYPLNQMHTSKSSSLLMQHSTVASGPQKPTLNNPLSADDIMEFLK